MVIALPVALKELQGDGGNPECKPKYKPIRSYLGKHNQSDILISFVSVKIILFSFKVIVFSFFILFLSLADFFSKTGHQTNQTNLHLYQKQI